MYTGHSALALVAKSRRPAIALALLIPVAFAPDWLKVLFSFLGHENRQLSHSLVSVGIGATLVALLYFAWSRSAADAGVLWLTYASHWPADYLTGIKPTWPGGPNVGLLLYNVPYADVTMESALVVICWFIYRRSLPVESRRRAVTFLIPLGLIGLQILFDALNQYPALAE